MLADAKSNNMQTAIRVRRELDSINKEMSKLLYCSSQVQCLQGKGAYTISVNIINIVSKVIEKREQLIKDINVLYANGKFEITYASLLAKEHCDDKQNWPAELISKSN